MPSTPRPWRELPPRKPRPNWQEGGHYSAGRLGRGAPSRHDTDRHPPVLGCIHSDDHASASAGAFSFRGQPGGTQNLANGAPPHPCCECRGAASSSDWRSPAAVDARVGRKPDCTGVRRGTNPGNTAAASAVRTRRPSIGATPHAPSDRHHRRPHPSRMPPRRRRGAGCRLARSTARRDGSACGTSSWPSIRCADSACSARSSPQQRFVTTSSRIAATR